MREAGGRVHEQYYLKHSGVPGIDPDDDRHIDVVVTGLPYEKGTPVALDTTVVSPLHADGTPWKGAANARGASFARDRKAKPTTYPELVDGEVMKLVTAP